MGSWSACFARRTSRLSTVYWFLADQYSGEPKRRPSATEREESFALPRRWPIAAFACAARGELLQKSCANPFPRFWCNGTKDRGSTSYNLHFGAVKYESAQRVSS